MAAKSRNRLVEVFPYLFGCLLYILMLSDHAESAVQALGGILAVTILYAFFSRHYRKVNGSSILISAVFTLMYAGICFAYSVRNAGFDVTSVFRLPVYLIGLSAGCMVYLIYGFAGDISEKIGEAEWLPYMCMIAAGLIYGVLLAAGKDVNGQGTRAWIRIAGFSFQLTEIAKPVAALFYAGLFGSHRRGTLVKLVWATVFLAVNSIGSLAIKELGSFTILFLLHMVMVTVLIPSCSLKRKYLGLLILTVFFLVSVFMLLYSYYQDIEITGGIRRILYALSIKVYERFSVLLRINKDPYSSGYQMQQADRALWISSLIGRNRAHFTALPVAESDMAWVAFILQFGYLPGLIVAGAFYVIFRETIRLAKANYIMHTKGAVLIYACGTIIFLQGGFMMLASCNLAPLAGLPVPFLSYGGAAQLVFFCLAAMILRTSENDGRGMEV